MDGLVFRQAAKRRHAARKHREPISHLSAIKRLVVEVAAPCSDTSGNEVREGPPKAYFPQSCEPPIVEFAAPACNANRAPGAD
jgi:hypothetical protein